MWRLVRENNSVWFFDATGNVLEDVKGQNKPFLLINIINLDYKISAKNELLSEHIDQAKNKRVVRGTILSDFYS